MRIKAVRLENIRSHVDTRVDFRPGLNCLIGGLGAGKTSILYAIDFALFGEPLGRSYAYLLREGADRAKVTLWFTHNGSDYVIIRGLRRLGNRIVQDTGVLRLFKDGRIIAEKRTSSVAEQLARELGFDCELFREVMWVRQEKLKEILDMRPGDRQKLFDALLGLEAFERAWASLRDLEKYYKHVKETYERDPDVLAAGRLAEEHAEFVEELARISAELEELELEVDKAAKEVDETRAKLAELEEARRKYERLREEKARREASLKETERAIERFEAEVKRRQANIERLEAELKALVEEELSHRQALTLLGLESGITIEEAEEELRKAEERLRELEAEAARAERDIKEAEERLKIISTQSTCPTCLRFISEDDRRKLTAKLEKQIVKRRHDLEAAREEAKKLMGVRGTLSEAIKGLRVVEARKADLKVRLEEERNSLEQAQRELDSARMRAEMLKVDLKALEEKLVGLSEAELEAARAELEVKSRKLAELEGKLKDLRARRDIIKERLADCEKRLKLAEEKKARAERAARLVELVKLFRSAYRGVQPHLRTEVVRLAKFYIQNVLNEISGPEGSDIIVEVSQDYTPVVKVAGRERSILHLSGGERTLLALAYRIGMGHLIMQCRTGRGLELLLLDEPTESLGREDLSIDKLADAIARLRVVEQVIAVSHSEAFAERANHVIRVEKADNVSRVRTEGRA